MGKQPKDLLEAFLSSTKQKYEGLRGTSQGGKWWTRVPQLLNLARYTLNSLQQDSVLDYDPFYLHITPAEVHPLATKTHTPSRVDASASCLYGNRIGLESFQYLLDQLPSVLSIEFSGQINDPLKNPELLQMVDYAYRYNGAESTIYTDGLLLGGLIDDMVKSRLHTIIINMVGHRPSSYSFISGQPLTQFMTILNNVKALLEHKKFFRSKLSVELRMTVDVHNFQEIPAMIQFAEDLGADGIHFDNYLSPDGTKKSDRSLYSHQQAVVRYMKEIENLYTGNEKFSVFMPKMLELDMSAHRHCKDAFNTVSVDSEFNVSACSRHLLMHGELGKIWDEDFFNNSMYQWLRSIYTHNQDLKLSQEVPLACQGCPKNMPGLDIKKQPGKPCK